MGRLSPGDTLLGACTYEYSNTSRSFELAPFAVHHFLSMVAAKEYFSRETESKASCRETGCFSKANLTTIPGKTSVVR